MSVYSLLEAFGEFPFCTFIFEEIEDALLQYDHIMLGSSAYHNSLCYGNESVFFINIACCDNFKESNCLSESKMSDLLLHRYKYICSTTSIQEGIDNGNKIISILNHFPHGDSSMLSTEHLLQAQVCHAAFTGDCDYLESFLPYVGVGSDDCLHYAAAGGHVDIVRKLIEEGCPVDKTNSHGQTPLHVAALFGRTEVVVELLKNGADIDKTIVEDYTCCPPLDGVVNGLPEHLNAILTLLDEGYSFRSDLNVFLLIFMRERNKLMLELRKEVLVDSVSNCYSDADLQTEWGKFPGTVTTFLRSLLKLIRTGESTESEALVFGAALHQAALRGHLDTVQVLLEWNCDPCSVDSLGRSALHVAAGVNIPDASINLYVNVVAHLVLGGCPVNMKNNWGCSPLHIAAHAGQSKIVTELLTHGADKDAFAGHFGTPLHQAALKSHLLTLKALLDEGCNVCAVDEVGRTPLHCAATNGHVDVARELLIRGCPVDVADNKGHTPLHNAANRGQSEMVLGLIREGAKRDVAAGECGTPLHQAALGGHLPTLKALLDEGCNVCAVDENGRTPLHCAAANGHVDVARELHLQGCPVDVADNKGFTPLHYAVANGQSEMVSNLIKNGAEKDFVAGKKGPLHFAANGGHLRTAAVLLEEGCNVSAVDENGRTPLHWASTRGHVDVVRELISRGCPVDITDNKGCTSLHDAACNGQSEVVAELIKSGAEKDVLAGASGSPLHCATKGDHLQTVKILLDEDSNFMCKVEGIGSTPLHWAAKNGHVDVLRELLRRGCPVDVVDNVGCTPLHNAAYNGQSEVVIELIRNGAEKDIVAGKYGSPLHQAANNGHLQTMRVLLDEGCNDSAVDEDGKTPLHWASTTGHVDVVRELITRGCPVDITDKKGWTPLHEAAHTGQSEVVVKLIRNGAEKDKVAGEFGSPLHQAVCNGNLQTVKALLDEGCIVSICDINHQTPLHWVSTKDHVDIARELITRGCPVDITDKEGRIPLHYAASKGLYEMVVLLITNPAEKGIYNWPLLSMGALNVDGSTLHFAAQRGDELIKIKSYINTEDARKRTPVHDAAAGGFNDIIVELVTNGAKKSIVSGKHGTPLHEAVTKGHVKTVKLLMDFGYNVLTPNTDGTTAYELAVEHGCMSIVKEINKHYRSTYIASKDGRTLLHYAVLCNKPESIAQLCKQGVNINCSVGSFGAPLHQAAGKGYLEAARTLLDAGCDVHVLDKQGRTPLHWAASEGHMDLVRELLERSRSTNVRDKLGRTPLHDAAANGESEMVIELIRKGAEKDIVAGKYGSPLHQAANNGHLQTVKALLDEGCNVSVVNVKGQTPLHLSSTKGHVDVVRELITRGCPVDITDNDGHTPLHVEAYNNQSEMITKLIRNYGAKKDIVAGKFGSPLHQAASYGSLQTVRVLLGEGCNVSAVNEIGRTPLHCASIKGKVDVVRELISRGCPVDITDNEGCTPLHEAAGNGQSEVVLELIRNGAEKDILASEYGSPLHRAASYGKLQTVRVLLGEGCDVSVVNEKGQTPLHLSSTKGHVDVVRELITRGCPVDITDNEGRTPLHDAACSGQSEVVSELIKNGAEKDILAGEYGSPLHQAASRGHLQTVEALLDEGCLVSVADKNGRTPLHWISNIDHLEVVRELISRGCPVDITDKNGETPLHHAALKGPYEMVVLLITNAAKRGRYIQPPLSMGALNEDGSTALHLAAQRGNVYVIRQILRSARGQQNVGDKFKRTPLHDAAANGQTNAAVELIKENADKNFVAGTYGTPLHEAVTKGYVKTVKCLLDLGCNVLIPNTNGITAYEFSVEHNFMSIVEEINKHPCSANMASKDGFTILHYAVFYNKSEWIAELCKQGVNINCSIGSFGAPLHQAAGKGYLEAARALLDAGCDVHVLDARGRTPLHWAALEGHVDVVRELLERNRSTDTKDKLGRTPLHDAAANGHTEIVIELVKTGADVNIVAGSLGKQIQEADGYTPLHFAAQSGKETVVVELIRWGADKNPVCRRGHTPLYLAGSQSHVETFISLLDEGCDMESLRYSFITAIEKHPKTTTRAILTALLERGFMLHVSQAPLLSRPLVLAKKKQLQTMKFEIQDKPSWFQHYHRALSSHGYIRVNIIRCVLVGPPKVGKSCLKHLLVHNKSKRVEHSTPVMESPDVVSFSRGMYLAGTQATSNSSWKYVNDVDMGAILKGWTESESYFSSDGYPKSPANTGLDTKFKLPTDVTHQSHNTTEVHTTKATSSTFKQDLVNVEQILIPKQSCIEGFSKVSLSKQPCQWDLKVQHHHLVSKMREFESHITGREAASTAVTQAVGYTTLVNLIDSGGQPSFMDTLPLLLGTPCTYVHVFNASKDVDSPAEMNYRDKHGQETVMECKETTWELMLRSFSSVHTLKYKCTKHLQNLMEEDKSVPQCRIAIVGTFKDELMKCSKHNEVITSLNARLEGLCKNMHSSLTFIANDQSNDNERCLFLVNNLLYEDSQLQDKMKCAKEAQYVDSLRNALSSEKAALQLKIPLMWLMLELVTRRSGVKYIKYKELKSFCLEHGYIDDNEDSEDQFRALLMLFHDLGFYAYYELKGIKKEDTFVCTEATALFKEVSKLLIIHFITPKSIAAQHFQETGEILTQNDQYKELFSEIDIDPAIDQRWFLMVVHHLGLAARVSNSAYFVPLALPYGRVNLDVECTVAKLCFALKSKETFSNTYHLPRSVFPRLIVILSNDRDNWEPDLPRSARTTVKFIHRGAHVYITELATLVEVTLILPQVSFFGYDSSFIPSASDTNKLHSLCSSVRSALTKAMGEACKSIFGDRYTEDAFVTDGFLCSHCERSRETPHLAEPSKSERMPLVCCVTKELFPVSPTQRIWLAEIEPTSVQVQLVKENDGIPAYWCLEYKQAISRAFDRHAFMEKFKETFLCAVPAKVVADKWEIFHIIDLDTCERIKRALPSDESAILFKHIRDHGSLETVKEMCKQMIVTGEDGYPQLRRLGEDMKRDFENLNT